MHLNIVFQQNFIFKNFICENFIFRKFYQILFDFISFLFYLINFFFFQNLFYNEQCSFSDSGKKYRVENQFEKLSRTHKHPTGPAGTPRCALARPGAHWRAQARTWPAYRGRVPGRVVARGRPCRRPQWPYRSIPAAHPARFRPRPSVQLPNASACSPLTLARSAYRVLRAPAKRPVPYRGRPAYRACSQAWPYRGLPRDPVPSRLATIQYFALQPISSPTKHLTHNTSSVLRYTDCLAYPLPVAIQGLISQYNPQPSPLLLQYNIFSCNTNGQ